MEENFRPSSRAVLSTENELQKNARMRPLTTTMAAIELDDRLSLAHRSRLLAVGRGRHYYEPLGESPLNLRIMRLMDEHYLTHPYKGPRRMRSWLTREHDIELNLKRLNRLYYNVMGLQSVLPGPHTSKPSPGYNTCPYLLRRLTVERPNQVWQTDISYVPMSGGYLYLTA